MSDISIAASNVIPFSFGKQQVRTLLIDDQPWFVANDVSAALQYSEASAMTRHLDDDEKGLSIVQTLGGDQEMLVINESGLYSAILRSRKAEAKRFKKWVTAEVLPAIRKQGSYEDSSNKMKTLIDDLVDMTETNALKGLTRHKVAHLPASIQRSASARIYSAVHTRFNVPRLELIPASQFESACNFIAAYAVLEGEFIPKGQGRSVDIPEKLGECERYLVSADHHGNRQVTPVPMGAFVLTRQQFMQAMLVDRDMYVSTAEMFEFVALATENLRCRFISQAARRNAA
ncbi:Bro-N domain-containing protein [Pseudomonas fluorescens]|nr:Bro-N domain-containing protein [Pseudomonas fluorescens]MDV3058623.1 BRO family protein [Pseudomonas paracarnis]